MVSRSGWAPFVAFVVCAAIGSAAPAVSSVHSLAVRTWIPDVDVDGSGGLKVTTVITNTGDETLKLVNTSRGVLSPFPGDAFNITDPSGSRLLLDGASVDYNPTHAAELDRPGAFTVLVPGQSINVTHDLSAVYDLAQSRVGGYSIEPSNVFTYLDADGSHKDLYATVEGTAEVTASGDRVAIGLPWWKSKHKHKHQDEDEDEGITFHACSEKERAVLIAAAEAAERTIDDTYAYVKDLRGSTPRYAAFYGAYDESRAASVRKHWRLMSENPNTRLSTLSYTCTCGSRAPVAPSGRVTIAWVNPAIFMIRLCPPFWKLRPKSQSIILVHESSHFLENGDSRDHEYGKEACQKLAKEDPEKAVTNADSFALFALNKGRLA